MMTRKKILYILLGFIVLSFCLYANSIKGNFVYDDFFFADRQELKNSGHFDNLWLESYIPDNNTAGAFRPLTIFSFALNFNLFGGSTTSFHITNIVLNGLNSFLLFLIIFQLFKNLKLAAISAVIFMFFPIHTQAVAFIKSRDELLGTFFVLSSWLVFLRAMRLENDFKRILASSLLFFLALLSKEHFIIVPAVFIFIQYCLGKPRLIGLLKIAICYLPVTLIYFTMRYATLGKYTFGNTILLFVINPLQNATFPAKIWTPFKIAYIYISETFIPHNLSATYSFNHLTLVVNPFTSPSVLLGILMLTILIVLIFSKKLRI